MAIYKLRVTFEDFEDIYRDIEIRSGHTFVDFHRIILESIGFDQKHAASFFVSDDFWRKGDEVTLLEEDLEPGVKLMKNVKISSCIEQPNQRFIYLYDKKALWSFQIELIKLVPEDMKVSYPRMAKSVGQPPKQYKQQLLEKLKAEAENPDKESDLDEEEDKKPHKIRGEEKLVYVEDEEKSLVEDESEMLMAGEEHEGEKEEGEEPGEDAEHESH